MHGQNHIKKENLMFFCIHVFVESRLRQPDAAYCFLSTRRLYLALQKYFSITTQPNEHIYHY